MTRARIAVVLLLAACSARHDAPVRIDSVPSAKVHGAANIQRTLRLLETRTTPPEPVRVLFYGQSITQSGWSRTVARELTRRYPGANLTIENRAIGGFSSEHLLKAAESDLYPYYPDLVIFHVYGSHFAYEVLIRRIRERTTAEILLATDHVVDPAELDEESDPSVLEPDEDAYPAFMNHAFLPKIAARYDAALCDVRGAWKRFLLRRGLPPSALLLDNVHLNAAGDQLMAEIVLGCIRRRPEVGLAPMERSIERVLVRDAQWNGGVLELRFHGNRVDALLEGEGEVQVSVDGKKPSEWADLYAFTRARSNGAPWPPLYEIGSAAQPLLEDWTLHVDRINAEPPYYRFELMGTRTGRDGRGDSRFKFASKSQRVVIDPEDWNAEYAFELAGMLTVPPHFTIAWSVEPHFHDVVHRNGDTEGTDDRITLAQGLPNAEHRLILRSASGEPGPVKALVVYRPPGDPMQPRVFSPEPEQ